MTTPRILGPSQNFLGLPKDLSTFAGSRAIVNPIPAGTASAGPGAILAASRSVSPFDEETKRDLSVEGGIATAALLAPKGKRTDAMLQAVFDAVSGFVEAGKFVVTVGGDHTISSATIAAHARRFPGLSVLHFDAHSGLRESRKGDPHSHATVMARVCEFLDPQRLTQVGVRSQHREEAEFIQERGVKVFFAHEIRNRTLARVLKDWDDLVVESLTDQVYVSVDLDVFDPSILPSVADPEPNGLTWHEVTACLRKVARRKHIVGADVTGLVPAGAFRYADVTAARLVAKFLHYPL